MSMEYHIEGFRSKATAEEEDTKLFDFSKTFKNLEEATLEAKEHFAKDENLGLAVISKTGPAGNQEGLKFIFRDKEGTFEEADLYWGDWLCHEG